MPQPCWHKPIWTNDVSDRSTSRPQLVETICSIRRSPLLRQMLFCEGSDPDDAVFYSLDSRRILYSTTPLFFIALSPYLPFPLSPFLPFSLSPFLPFSLSPFPPFSFSPFPPISFSPFLAISFSPYLPISLSPYLPFSLSPYPVRCSRSLSGRGSPDTFRPFRCAVSVCRRPFCQTCGRACRAEGLSRKSRGGRR